MGFAICWYESSETNILLAVYYSLDDCPIVKYFPCLESTWKEPWKIFNVFVCSNYLFLHVHFKFFIDFVTILLVLCFSFLVMRHVGSCCLTNNWTHTACIGRQSLNHWTNRKFLSIYLKKNFLTVTEMEHPFRHLSHLNYPFSELFFPFVHFWLTLFLVDI